MISDLNDKIFRPERAGLHYRPYHRAGNAVLVEPNGRNAQATHLAAASIHDRSQADLNTWLRYAVSGTSLVLHLAGDEELDCARRLAWFVETCRRFDIDLDVASNSVTRNALELLHALGADVIRFDESLKRDRNGRAVMRRVRYLAESLHMCRLTAAIGFDSVKDAACRASFFCSV